MSDYLQSDSIVRLEARQDGKTTRIVSRDTHALPTSDRDTRHDTRGALLEAGEHSVRIEIDDTRDTSALLDNRVRDTRG